MKWTSSFLDKYVKKLRCPNIYGKCPKISYTTLKFDKIPYANSADPGQTASEEAVDQSLHCLLCH